MLKSQFKILFLLVVLLLSSNVAAQNRVKVTGGTYYLSPLSLFDSLTAYNIFRFTPNAGPGKVLTSDADGVASWSVPVTGFDSSAFLSEFHTWSRRQLFSAPIRFAAGTLVEGQDVYLTGIASTTSDTLLILSGGKVYKKYKVITDTSSGAFWNWSQDGVVISDTNTLHSQKMSDIKDTTRTIKWVWVYLMENNSYLENQHPLSTNAFGTRWESAPGGDINLNLRDAAGADTLVEGRTILLNNMDNTNNFYGAMKVYGRIDTTELVTVDIYPGTSRILTATRIQTTTDPVNDVTIWRTVAVYNKYGVVSTDTSALTYWSQSGGLRLRSDTALDVRITHPNIPGLSASSAADTNKILYVNSTGGISKVWDDSGLDSTWVYTRSHTWTARQLWYEVLASAGVTLPWSWRISDTTNAVWGHPVTAAGWTNGPAGSTNYIDQVSGFQYNPFRTDVTQPNFGTSMESKYWVSGAWHSEFHIFFNGVGAQLGVRPYTMIGRWNDGRVTSGGTFSDIWYFGNGGGDNGATQDSLTARFVMKGFGNAGRLDLFNGTFIRSDAVNSTLLQGFNNTVYGNIIATGGNTQIYLGASQWTDVNLQAGSKTITLNSGGIISTNVFVGADAADSSGLIGYDQNGWLVKRWNNSRYITNRLGNRASVDSVLFATDSAKFVSMDRDDATIRGEKGFYGELDFYGGVEMRDFFDFPEAQTQYNLIRTESDTATVARKMALTINGGTLILGGSSAVDAADKYQVVEMRAREAGIESHGLNSRNTLYGNQSYLNAGAWVSGDTAKQIATTGYVRSTVNAKPDSTEDYVNLTQQYQVFCSADSTQFLAPYEDKGGIFISKQTRLVSITLFVDSARYTRSIDEIVDTDSTVFIKMVFPASCGTLQLAFYKQPQAWGHKYRSTAKHFLTYTVPTGDINGSTYLSRPTSFIAMLQTKRKI